MSVSVRDITQERRLKELKSKLSELGLSEKDIEDIINKIKSEDLEVKTIRVVNDCVYVSDTTVIKSLVYEREWFLPIYGSMTKEQLHEYQDEYGASETYRLCTESQVSVIYHRRYEENSGRIESNVKEVIILRKAQ